MQEYIESGATYIVLSAQGVSEFQLNDGGGKDGNEERVRKWINDMFSKDGDFMTPGSSDDGTFIGAT